MFLWEKKVEVLEESRADFSVIEFEIISDELIPMFVEHAMQDMAELVQQHLEVIHAETFRVSGGGSIRKMTISSHHQDRLLNYLSLGVDDAVALSEACFRRIIPI